MTALNFAGEVVRGDVLQPVVAKRASVQKRLGLGATLLREFYTPGSANYDPSFPAPFRYTKNGCLYFSLTEIDEWLRLRRREGRKLVA